MRMCLTVVMGDDSEGEEEEAELFLDSKPRSNDKSRESRKEREERLKKMMEGKAASPEKTHGE